MTVSDAWPLLVLTSIHEPIIKFFLPVQLQRGVSEQLQWVPGIHPGSTHGSWVLSPQYIWCWSAQKWSHYVNRYCWCYFFMKSRLSCLQGSWTLLKIWLQNKQLLVFLQANSAQELLNGRGNFLAEGFLSGKCTFVLKLNISFRTYWCLPESLKFPLGKLNHENWLASSNAQSKHLAGSNKTMFDFTKTLKCIMGGTCLDL